MAFNAFTFSSHARIKLLGVADWRVYSSQAASLNIAYRSVRTSLFLVPQLIHDPNSASMFVLLPTKTTITGALA